MSLIAWYKLDNDASDSLRAYNALSTTNVTYTSGKIKNAATFNGNGYIDLPNIFASNMISSVSLFVKVTAWDAANEAIIFGHHQYDWGSLRISTSAINVRWCNSNNTIIDVLTGPYEFSLNIWYHIAVVFRISSAAVYVNGQVIQDKTTTFAPSIYEYNFLGRGNIAGDTSIKYLTGQLEDVRFYNHALSHKEIKELSKIKVLHYTFDTIDTIDISNYNNTGTPSSNLLNTDVFKIGKASYLFSNKYITTPIFELSPTKNWTVSVWVKTSTNGPILSSSNSGTVASGFSIVSSKISLNWYNGSWQTTSGTSTVTDNNWHLLTWTNLNQKITMYVDRIKEVDDVPWSITNTGPVDQIGKNWSSSYFNGYMSDFRIYFTALDSLDVAELHKTRIQLDNIGNYYNSGILDENENSTVKLRSNGVSNIEYLSEAEVTDGLIGWWPLGTTSELAARRTATASNVTITLGVNNAPCYDFDGAASYVDLNYGQGITLGVTSITMWVKSDLPAASRMCLSSGQVPDNGARLYLATYNGYWNMGIATTSWGEANILATSDWTFLSLIMDGSTASLYANLQLSKQINYLSYILNQNIRLGTHGTDNQYYWNGQIQDVRIYNRALTLSELSILYNQTGGSAINKAKMESNALYIKGQFKETYS